MNGPRPRSKMEVLYQIYKNSTGVCTDTRAIEKGNIFFALKGDNFNGNLFASKALDSGAIHAVIDEGDDSDPRVTKVDDVLTTLQELATFHRNKLDIPFIGLTGSNGKTTSKELIHAVLSKKYKAVATKGNLNNHIGVPLTLLAIPEDAEIAIIEMGANHQGEIAALSEIARPDFGMITNIGKAHLEGFGGIEGVARGKSELYRFIFDNGGEIFVNGQDEMLLRMSSRFESTINYLGQDAYYNCKMIASSPFVVLETEDGETVETQLVGDYNFDNMAAALCIGKYFEVDGKHAAAALREYTPTNNRSQVLEHGGITFIMDAYNANPSSMSKAIINFSKMEGSKKLALLGDMFELGESSIDEHQTIIDLCAELKVGSVFYGKEFEKCNLSDEFGVIIGDEGNLINHLKSIDLEGFKVLVKGSRGMKLEGVIDSIK